MALLKKKVEFEGTNDYYAIKIWEREDDEDFINNGRYSVSISDDLMQEIDLDSVSDIEKVIEELQNAIKFIREESEG